MSIPSVSHKRHQEFEGEPIAKRSRIDTMLESVVDSVARQSVSSGSGSGSSSQAEPSASHRYSKPDGPQPMDSKEDVIDITLEKERLYIMKL